jgi:molybdenum cofactor cytidylyltransferase
MPALRSAVAGVIMAAGLSGRFGRNKLLEPFRGRPLLRWTIEAALRSRLLCITVILGHEQDRIRHALTDFAGEARLSFTFNPSYRDGQSGSVVAAFHPAAPRQCFSLPISRCSIILQSNA